MSISKRILAGIVGLGMLAAAWADNGESGASQPAVAATATPAASDSQAPTAAQAETLKKAKSVFSMCDADKIATLAQVDALKGLDAEGKALCKERLKLLNPVIE